MEIVDGVCAPCRQKHIHRFTVLDAISRWRSQHPHVQEGALDMVDYVLQVLNRPQCNFGIDVLFELGQQLRLELLNLQITLIAGYVAMGCHYYSHSFRFELWTTRSSDHLFDLGLRVLLVALASSSIAHCGFDDHQPRWKIHSHRERARCANHLHMACNEELFNDLSIAVRKGSVVVDDSSYHHLPQLFSG